MSGRPKNLDELMRALAVSIDATEAAAFAVHGGFFQNELEALVHLRPADGEPEHCARAIEAFGQLVRQCIDHAKDGAFEVGEGEGVPGKQFCLVTLARRNKDIVGAAAFVVRSSDVDAAQLLLKRVQS